jgi:hypothetical protein
MPSRPSSSEATSTWLRIACSAIRISSCANDAPRQRRTRPEGDPAELAGAAVEEALGAERVGLGIDPLVVVHEVDAADERGPGRVGAAPISTSCLMRRGCAIRQDGTAAQDLLDCLPRGRRCRRRAGVRQPVEDVGARARAARKPQDSQAVVS